MMIGSLTRQIVTGFRKSAEADAMAISLLKSIDGGDRGIDQKTRETILDFAEKRRRDLVELIRIEAVIVRSETKASGENGAR